MTAQQARLACDAVLLVLCLDDKTAAWAGQPVPTPSAEALLTPAVPSPTPGTRKTRARRSPA